MAEPLNLVGQRFGRLVVTEYVGINRSKSGHTYSQFKCLCDCGNETIKRGTDIKSGSVNSCGCLRREISRNKATYHGFTHTKLYNVWKSMRGRCNCPSDQAYKNYGGRGITYDPSWEDYKTFHEWAYRTGYVQDSGLTLERIDVNKGYSPDNCCWVDMKRQSNNKRNNLYFTIDGVTHTLAEWCEIHKVPYARTEARVQTLGWNIEDALTRESVRREYTLTLNGETKTAREWSKITGISTQTIRNRKKSGWNDTDALTTPLMEKGGTRRWQTKRMK